MRLITREYGMRLSNVCCVPYTVSCYSDNSGNMVSLYMIWALVKAQPVCVFYTWKANGFGFLKAMLLVISNLLSIYSCSYMHQYCLTYDDTVKYISPQKTQLGKTKLARLEVWKSVQKCEFENVILEVVGRVDVFEQYHVLNSASLYRKEGNATCVDRYLLRCWCMYGLLLGCCAWVGGGGGGGGGGGRTAGIYSKCP